MKKILSVILVGIMSLSVLLFCGFSAPIIEGDDLQSTKIKQGDFVDNIYFNYYVGTDLWQGLFDTYNLTPVDGNDRVTLIEFEDSSKNIVLFCGDNKSIDGVPIVYNQIYNDDFEFEFFVHPMFGVMISNNFITLSNIDSNVVRVNKQFDYFDILFSSTPFEIPNGGSIQYTDIPAETTLINGLYLNTFLSTEEVNSILMSIDYTYISEYNMHVYSPGTVLLQYQSYNMPFIYYFNKVNDRYGITFSYFDIMGEAHTVDVFDSVNGWTLDEYLNVYISNPVYNLFTNQVTFTSSDFTILEGIYNFSLYDNEKLGSLFSSTPFEIVGPPSFVEELIDDLATVFIEYIPALTSAIVTMFTSLMFVEGSLTTLGTALLTIIGICLVSSIFRIVYKIFKGKSNRKI